MKKMQNIRKSMRLNGKNKANGNVAPTKQVTKQPSKRKSLRKSLPKLFTWRNTQKAKRNSEVNSESQAIETVTILELNDEVEDALQHLCIEKVVSASPQVAYNEFVEYVWKENAGLGYFTSALFLEKRDSVMVNINVKESDFILKQGSVKKSALFQEEVTKFSLGEFIEYEVFEGPFPAEFFRGRVIFEPSNEVAGETVISWHIWFKPLNFALLSMAVGEANAESFGVQMMSLMIKTIFPLLLYRLGNRIAKLSKTETLLPTTKSEIQTVVAQTVESSKTEIEIDNGESDEIIVVENKNLKLQWAARRLTGYEGNMTEQQIKALGELKYRLENNYKGSENEELITDILSHPDGERWLVRFLRAECSKKKRNFNVDISEKRLLATAKFRREVGAAEILDNPPDNYDLFQKVSPELILVDVEHRPIVFTRAGALANYLNFSQFSDFQWKRFLTYNSEFRLNMCRQNSVKYGYEISATVAVYDIEHVGHNSLRIMPLVKLINAVAAQHYPEFVDQIILVNAPRIFSILYGMVKGILDPVTREKVQIYSKSKGDLAKMKKMFCELVNEKELPKEYGGQSEIEVLWPQDYLNYQEGKKH